MHGRGCLRVGNFFQAPSFGQMFCSNVIKCCIWMHLRKGNPGLLGDGGGAQCGPPLFRQWRF